MQKLEYESPDGDFSIFFNEKLLKVIGHERSNDSLRGRLITLESYTFVSLAQFKSVVNRLLNCKIK